MKRLDKRVGTVRLKSSTWDITGPREGIHAIAQTACGAHLDASHLKLILT